MGGQEKNLRAFRVARCIEESRGRSAEMTLAGLKLACGIQNSTAVKRDESSQFEIFEQAV
jgi:hypothetical protein